MTLFIGGPLDGTERHVQKGQTKYSICTYKGPRFYAMTDAVSTVSAHEVNREVTQQHYYRHQFGSLEFFALSDSPVHALQILLAAYPRKR